MQLIVAGVFPCHYLFCLHNILHLVWKSDRADGEQIPACELCILLS